MSTLSRRLSMFLKKQRLLKLISRTWNGANTIDSCQGFKKIHNSSCRGALLTCLKSRGLVRMQGVDTVNFLQGLVTNDVEKLREDQLSSQYAFMLNVQGRILYDLFIYNVTEKVGSPCTMFVDVPASATGEFISTLRKYKLRRKVDISDVSDEFQVWSEFSQEIDSSSNNKVENGPSDALISCPDPRLADFGKRLIRRNPHEEENSQVDESVYRESRYKWGLPEGVGDLPPGSCFPLESNAVFMNGVSFDKGCYIGQELTARTHYTGVTRKRLMPLVFNQVPPEIESDVTIKNEKGRNAGKLRGTQGSFGLGLVRMAHLKETLSVTACDDSPASLTTHIPHWWPEFDM